MYAREMGREKKDERRKSNVQHRMRNRIQESAGRIQKGGFATGSVVNLQPKNQQSLKQIGDHPLAYSQKSEGLPPAFLTARFARDAEDAEG